MAKRACYVGGCSYPMIQLSYSGFSSMSIPSLLIICRNIFLMSAVISDNNVTIVIVKDSLLYCVMTAFHIW